MNKRQKIIVSITGIFIVLLALVGLTYAYFLTQIRGNEETKSISIETAKMSLVYENPEDEYIIGLNEKIMPGKTFDEKTFTVTNDGTVTIENYAVILENVKTFYTEDFVDENSQLIEAGTQVEFKRPEDFILTISCTKKDGTSCNGVTNGTLPLMESTTDENIKYITNGILVTNTIVAGDTHTYKVVLRYDNPDDDQSADMNKTLEGKFNIIDVNNTINITGTVADYSPGDVIKTNSVPRISQINSDGSYKIVGLEEGVHTVSLVGETTTEISKLSIIKGTEEGFGETTINGVTMPQITKTNESSDIKVNIKDGKLESGEVKLISFTFDGFISATATAEEGMTWAEWLESDYVLNSTNSIISFELNANGYLVMIHKEYGTTTVGLGDDVIIDGNTYILA